MRTTAAFCVDPAHTIVLEQAARHRLHRALPQLAHAPAWPTLLPGERPAVMHIVLPLQVDHPQLPLYLLPKRIQCEAGLLLI